MNRKRNQQNSKSKRVILVSYEGDNKTEKNYFNSFMNRNSNYRIKVVPGNETDPINLVRQTILAVKNNGLDLSSDDIAYCIFDTDTNSLKDEQIKIAIRLANEHNIKVITSNPCIELWFLLHFEYTTATLTNNQVIARLKKYCLKYEKNYAIYKDLEDKKDIAISNAKKLEQYQLKNDKNLYETCSNPYTSVYKVVEELLE